MSGQICKANLQADKKRQIRELSVRVARRGVSYPHHSLRFTNRILLSTIRHSEWWKVESALFEYGKAEECYIYPL